jgi:hypothetical protein
MTYLPMPLVHVWEGLSVKRGLADVEGAANFLLLKWPKEFAETDLHHAARVAALDALNGDAPVSEFRDALIAAASEANILAEADQRRSTPLRGHIARPWRYSQKGGRRRRG